MLISSADLSGNERLQQGASTGEKKYDSVEEAITYLKARRASEVERFKRIYHVDIDNDENFDYVLDSTYHTPDEIVDLIIRKFKLDHCHHK